MDLNDNLNNLDYTNTNTIRSKSVVDDKFNFNKTVYKSLKKNKKISPDSHFRVKLINNDNKWIDNWINNKDLDCKSQ